MLYILEPIRYYGLLHLLLILYIIYTILFYTRVSSVKLNKFCETDLQFASPLNYYNGLLHLHSNYSHDAQGTYEEIAKIAGRQEFDFLIVTDHNNLTAISDGKEGWYGPTLVLTGVESSRPEGYLLGLNVSSYSAKRRDPTNDLLADIGKQGGFALIVHAENCRRPWKGPVDERISGLEILDFADQLYDCSHLAKLNAFLFYLANRKFAHLRIYHRPERALALWDRVASIRPAVGFYGPNMHQNVRIFGRQLKFPKAAEVMPLASNHILSVEKLAGDLAGDRDILYRAIRKGHLYFSVDLIGNAKGFMYSAEQQGRTAIMGDSLVAGLDTKFKIRLPNVENMRDLHITVYHNGMEIIRRKAAELEFQAREPGPYRVEVLARIPTFFGWGRLVPWIYSNPIYLRSDLDFPESNRDHSDPSRRQ